VGNKNERWSPAQGIESVLHSIQSVLSPDPYLNEPRFEKDKRGDKRKAYQDKIKHETIRIAVLQELERMFTKSQYSDVAESESLASEAQDPTHKEWVAWDNFLNDTTLRTLDTCRRLFLWYYDYYIDTIDTEAALHEDNTPFELTEFENVSNQMAGQYNYTSLRSRLIEMKSDIDTQIGQWIFQGRIVSYMEVPISRHIKAAFDRAVYKYTKEGNHPYEFQLPDENNPFHWRICIQSDINSLLEGAVVTVRFIISPSFPQEQPYARVLTPLFHYAIAKDGTLAYLVRDRNKLEDHVDAIIKTVLEPLPVVDHRLCINVEASKLLSGSITLGASANEKDYRKRVRRSAQRSLERQDQDS
jgi:ubiquitin-conjugating enzyme E2 Z